MMDTTYFSKFLSAGAQVYSGISTYNSAQDSASLIAEQGFLSQADFNRQANLIREDGVRFRAKQAMSYISSGVELSGTPLLVLKETLSKAEAKARSYDITGQNIASLAVKNSKIVKNEGMSSLVSSILNAAAIII